MLDGKTWHFDSCQPSILPDLRPILISHSGNTTLIEKFVRFNLSLQSSQLPIANVDPPSPRPEPMSQEAHWLVKAIGFNVPLPQNYAGPPTWG